MKTKVFILIGFILLLLLLSPASAIPAVPEMPAQIYGTLYNHEGKPFPAGTVIIAEVNGVTSTYTITEAGKIGGSGTFDKKFLVEGATSGSTITFSIQGTTEKITQVYNPETGGVTDQMQLTIPIEIPTTTTGGGGGGGVNPQTQQTQPVSPTETVPPLPTESVPTTAPTYNPQTTPTEPTKTIFPILGVLAGLLVAVRRT